MKFIKDKLYVLPLGGAGQMGDNCTVYYYNSSSIIVDYGLGLSKVDDITEYDAFCLDIEALMPLICKNGVVNLFITHCHDDHVSAVKYLIEAASRLSYTLKVYVTTLFNKNLMLYKADDIDPDCINIVGFGNVVVVDDLECTFYEVDHSIPESAALHVVVKKSGDVKGISALHSGDWNIYDKNVVSSLNADTECDISDYSGASKTLQMFKVLGGDNCDIIVNESTNILIESKKYRDGSIVYESLKKLLDKLLCSGKTVYFTCFSSCVNRALWLAKYAKDNNISMACTGRAFSDVFSAVRESKYGDYKYLDHIVMCHSIDAIYRGDYKIKLVTGCQNEPGSALNKLLNSPKVMLDNCAVVMSTSVIPPLQKRINQAYTDLIKSKRAVVYCNGTHPDMHYSGHATRNLILFMYKCLNPDCIIPVHGNYINIQCHSMLEKRIANVCKKPVTVSWGHNKFFVYERDHNGNIICTEDVMDASLVKRIYALDGFTFAANHPVLKSRKRLIAGGLICVNKRKKSIFCVGTRISDYNRARILKLISTDVDRFVIKNYIERKLMLKSEVLII